jgi:hypothetical protein
MALSKEAKAKVDNVLGRLDKMAVVVQENHAKWGMNFDVAKALVNDIDKVADEVELLAYGPESLVRRQVEVLKTAEVISRNPDEPYMDTFGNPQQPRQTNADEPYMSAYKSDDSSAVHHGKSTTGQPLAP